MSKTTAGASYLHALLHAEPAGEVTPRAWNGKEKTLLAVALALHDIGVNTRNIERVVRLANCKMSRGIDTIADEFARFAKEVRKLEVED